MKLLSLNVQNLWPSHDKQVPGLSLQMREPPAPVIATRDELLAVALAANVVALYQSRLPRDPHALSKPLELQVRALVSI